MPYNMKATTLNARELVFSVGGSEMSELAGQEVYVTKQGIKGWFGGGVAVRRDEQKRLWTHGNFSLPGTRDARLVSITGVAWGPTRRAASELKDRLNALMADGNIGKLTIIDPDEGMRWSNCYLTGTPEVDWDYDDTLTWTLDFICPNPRRFGLEATYSTGISEQGEGLQFPLFGGGPYTLVQINPVPNPNASVASSTTGWTGTGATLSTVAAANPAGARTFRATISNTTVGDFLQKAELTNRLPVAAGKEYTISAYARTVSTTYSRLRMTFYDSTGTAIGSTDSPNLVPNTGFQRLSVTDTAPIGAVSVQLSIGLPVDSPRATSAVFDWNGAQLDQAGSVRNYLDGAVVDTSVEMTDWAGTPGNSASQRMTIDGARGVLDFGVPGRMGTITFQNMGTADTYPQFWVNGYTPEFLITELETGRQLEFVGQVPRFQTMYLNAANGAVYLDSPEANRLEGLVRTEWPVIPGESTRTYLFESPLGPDARLFLKAAPAWW